MGDTHVAHPLIMYCRSQGCYILHPWSSLYVSRVLLGYNVSVSSGIADARWVAHRGLPMSGTLGWKDPQTMWLSDNLY